MSNLSREEWQRLNELKTKKNKTADDMAEMVALNCKLYGMAGKDS